MYNGSAIAYTQHSTPIWDERTVGEMEAKLQTHSKNKRHKTRGNSENVDRRKNTNYSIVYALFISVLEYIRIFLRHVQKHDKLLVSAICLSDFCPLHILRAETGAVRAEP